MLIFAIISISVINKSKLKAKTKTMEATALHMAAAGGHSKIVKILLENGADAEDENAVSVLVKFMHNFFSELLLS